MISMTASVETTLTFALIRVEIRGFHFLDDYPEGDEKNWLMNKRRRGLTV
jgi:succinate dehydrogenase/fumarate reductase flavoprotein subunit